MGLLGERPERADEPHPDRLFEAGVAYLVCGSWAPAWGCFNRIGNEDAATLYNKALCCFGVAWYEECHALLGRAEQLLNASTTAARHTEPRTPSCPEAFRRWERTSDISRRPLLRETPVEEAFRQVLRLKAEAAFRLGRREEVRSIAARLNGAYESIETLLKQIEP